MAKEKLRNLSGEEQYEDFKKFLIKLEDKVNDKLESQTGKRGFRLINLYYEYKSFNNAIHNKIMKRLLSYATEEEELSGLITAMKESEVGRAYIMATRDSLLDMKIDKNLNPTRHGAEETIYRYLSVYKNYYRIKNGELEYSDKDIYNYTNKNEFENKSRFVPDGVCLLLTQSGECYFSDTNRHKDLAGWLTSRGVQLSGAVRLMISHKRYEVAVTSMGNFDYTKDSNNDLDIEISKEQAKAIATIYSNLKSKWAKITNINKIAMYSSLFGGFGPKLTAHNLNNINELEVAFREFDNVDFSMMSYKKYLKKQLTMFDEDEEEW